MADMQQSVNTLQSPGIPGHFASTNPYFTYVAGPGGLVAGTSGLTTARFAWVVSPLDSDSAPSVANNYGAGSVAGFVGWDNEALITAYLAAASSVVPAGMPVSIFTGGDFWIKNESGATALVGQKVYADLLTGKASLFAATGGATGASTTSCTIAAGTVSGSGSITGGVLTTTSGSTWYPGTTLSGALVASGTRIVSQLTGVAYGAGTYAVSIGEQAVTTTTISGTYGVITVNATLTGTIDIGGLATISGSGTANYVTLQLTGVAGSTGTYVCTDNTVVAGSVSGTFTNNVETKWFVVSQGLANEYVKMSSHTLG